MVHTKGRNLDFRGYVRRDKAVFLNVMEFARIHDIDGHAIRSVLTSDSTAQKINAPDGENLSGGAVVLYADFDEISGVTAGQSVRIDGRIYTVKEARDIQGILWRISLEANVS